MRKLSINFLLLLLSVGLSAQVTTYTVGTSSFDFATLQEAFDYINQGATSGDIVLEIIDNTVETGTSVLYPDAGGTYYTSILIYPVSSGLSISGNIDGPLIELNGATNVIMDGRVGQSGEADLIITNTSISVNASTIKFVESSSNSAIRYCNIKGAGMGTATGVMFFSTATSGNGNDGIIIENNNITSDAAGRPVNAIFSLGTSGMENSSNAINNNVFFDLLNPGQGSSCIFLSSNNTSWNISGNSFYETSSFVPSGNVEFNLIQIYNTGTAFSLTDNYLGGTNPFCGGGPWSKTGTFNNTFTGINLNVGTAFASSVQNNTIKNFDWTNSLNASWTAINIGGGNVNIGTQTGNNIGETTGTGSILFTGGTTNANFYGINIAGTGTVDCQHNNIGSVTTANSNSSYATNFYGINKTASAGTVIINNNNIGSNSTPSSINASSICSPLFTALQYVYGIYNAGSGDITINNNNIVNLVNSTINPGTTRLGTVTGISSINGINTVRNNTVHDLTISNGNNSSTHLASACGISLPGTTYSKSVTGNIIFNIFNTFATFNGYVTGLFFSANNGNSSVSGNFIYNLSAVSSAANIAGIKVLNGSTTFSNNIISLGSNSPGNIYGIMEAGVAGNTINLYFNSVFISGACTSGTANSYGLSSSVIANTRNFRNNIFNNVRTNNGGTGTHYALRVLLTGGTITCDYNDYYVSGTGGILGFHGSSKMSLPIVTGGDVNSFAIDPVYTIPGGTSASNYTIGVDLIGVSGTGVLTDFGNITRVNPTMGAWESPINMWRGTLSTAWNVAANWSRNIIPLENTNIIFDPAAVNDLYLNINHSVTNITNGSGRNLATNGRMLTIKGIVTITGTGRINASSPSSTVAYSGLAPQTIEAGQFDDGKSYNLTIDNSLGVILNDDFTVDNALVINAAGNLTVSAGNQLIVTGTLTNNAGNSGLLLRSDASGDAKLLNNTASVPGTVELYLTGGLVSPGVGRFHYIIPPVASVAIGTTIDEVKTNLGVTNFEGDLLSYSEVVAGPNKNNGWQYFDGYPDQPPVFSSMVSSEGYNIYLTANDRLTFSGQLNGPSHAFNNLSFTSIGFNLVGNPYPTNYDLNGITALTIPGDNVDNTVIFNHDGTLAYWNVETNVGTTGYSDIIGPMQGFFVNVTAVGQSLNLPASYKTTTAALPLRSKGAYSNNSGGDNAVKKIKLVLNNGAVPDETIVCLIENASMKFDGDYDARKILGSEAKKVFGRGFGSESVPAIYTVLDSLKYAINSIPVPEESTIVIIPVSLELKSTGTYTIDISEFDNMEDLEVILKHGDVETRLSEGASYTFKAAAGNNNDFQLIIGQNNAVTVVEPLTNTIFSTWYSNSNLYIKCPDNISSGKSLVTIYDLQGREVYSNNQIYIIPGQTIQEAITLPKGVFVTHIVINKKPFISKIVVL